MKKDLHGCFNLKICIVFMVHKLVKMMFPIRVI